MSNLVQENAIVSKDMRSSMPKKYHILATVIIYTMRMVNLCPKKTFKIDLTVLNDESVLWTIIFIISNLRWPVQFLLWSYIS